MKRIILFLTIVLLTYKLGISQNFDLGQKFDKVPDTFELIGISSKDTSKIYRFREKNLTTVFSYTVDKFEIRVHKKTIVSLHFVLNPKNKSSNVPTDLIDKVKTKSGREPLKKDSQYYFDDISSKTVIFRKNIPEYGGDKIHIVVTSSKYLYK